MSAKSAALSFPLQRPSTSITLTSFFFYLCPVSSQLFSEYAPLLTPRLNQLLLYRVNIKSTRTHPIEGVIRGRLTDIPQHYVRPCALPCSMRGSLFVLPGCMKSLLLASLRRLTLSDITGMWRTLWTFFVRAKAPGGHWNVGAGRTLGSHNKESEGRGKTTAMGESDGLIASVERFNSRKVRLLNMPTMQKRAAHCGGVHNGTWNTAFLTVCIMCVRVIEH